MQRNHYQPYLHFPSLKEMYQGREKRVLKQIRNILRFLLRRPFIGRQAKRLLMFLNQHSLWLPLFRQNPHRFHAFLYRYCDKRFSLKQRTDQIIHTFTILEQKLGEYKCRLLVEQGSLPLCQLTNTLTLNLNLNMIDEWEGFFSLNFQDGSNKRYYDCSFALLEQQRLLIASIQGPKGEDAQQLVRLLTKECHGVRPMYLLVDCLKMIAEQWQQQLIGIPLKYQAKIQLYGSKRVLFNYDDFWRDNQATRTTDYWQLPLTIERRPLEEIQSKKRSMYRKRYEMFDLIKQAIQQNI
ncbi:VirK protein [Mergibacter septicus]|uniref:VirK/YbjX family protein n=1 Tax=Mergibacter septicus TaxID=221402 RepID=UPI0011798886|nr:DUF535 family protein [Mergibacter septicus]AWX14143.1 VirK protein [Mergibacter septicus]